tara:strand:+ start:39806 stop:40915 length:1110 start_codon:yes stop_codon:yes gene_type:complete
MARPSRDTIQSGVNGWDASVNDNFTRTFDLPLAIHEHVGDESDLASTFPAASYDNCLVWVNHTVDGWTPYHSDGSTWDKLFERFSAAFTASNDTPANYTGDSLKFVRVNVGETALEFVTLPVDTFLTLTDVTPSTYTGQASKVVAVNVGETALEFITPAAGDFLGLSDTPSAFTGDSLKSVRVNVGETALEFFNAAAATAFLGLSDTPGAFTGEASKVVSVNVGETALEFTTPSSGTTVFTGLTDTPANFTGSASKVVSVNVGETALEFTTPAAGGGAMTVQSVVAVDTADSDENLLCVCSGTTYTLTLPSASTVGAGHRLTVKRTSSGTITIDGDTADTIDAASTFDLSIALTSLTLVSDGTSNWHIV